MFPRYSKLRTVDICDLLMLEEQRLLNIDLGIDSERSTRNYYNLAADCGFVMPLDQWLTHAFDSAPTRDILHWYNRPGGKR